MTAAPSKVQSARTDLDTLRPVWTKKSFSPVSDGLLKSAKPRSRRRMSRTSLLVSVFSLSVRRRLIAFLALRIS